MTAKSQSRSKSPREFRAALARKVRPGFKKGDVIVLTGKQSKITLKITAVKYSG